MRAFITLLVLLFAANEIFALTDKPCEEIQMRFACKEREDCVWVGAVVGCASLGPTSPPVPTTPKPTKAPTTKAPVTKKPTAAPVVPSKKPTKAPVEPTAKPTKAPTLRECNSFTAKVGCTTFGAGRCQWTKNNKCKALPTKRPTKTPTFAPTKRPTLQPTNAPTNEPTKSPSLGPRCADFRTKLACCGKKFANGNSNKCVNTLVLVTGCKWAKKGSKMTCQKGNGTGAPTPPPGTKSPTTKAPTTPTTRGPTKKPTLNPTKKGQKKTNSPTPEYEYEYEYEWFR